jgi:hypothetical protein
LCKAQGILPLSYLLSSSRVNLRRETLAVMKWVLADGMADAQKAFAHHFLGTRLDIPPASLRECHTLE